MTSRIYFSLSLVLLALSGKANAQADTARNDVFGGFIIVPIEFPVIDTRDINQQLGRYSLPSIKYAAANWGIGLQLYVNRGIITFSYNQTTKEDDQGTYMTEVEYRSTSLSFGYSLIKSQAFSIYPYVGFKGSGLNYLYREKL